jgi:Secretion system C-terminal sorting domain
VYYHDSVPDDQCLKGDFYFYFRLDTTMFKTLNNGKFMFELQACCGVTDNPPFTDYNVVFHVLPNGTDTCFTLDFSDTTHLSVPGCTGVNCSTAWIPLSMTGSRIATHCPGCAAPGIIVDNYKLRRKTFGFQDSDNDAIADLGFIPIVEGNQWFNAYENLLDLNQSSLGDIIEDKLWAHFQPGDSSSGGYTYVQMYNLPTNIRLPYLQLLRTIPAGIDTMNLQIQEFTLYIDTLGTAGLCIDCNEFQIPSQFKTMLAIHVSQAGIANYVDIDAPNNRWLFTFEAPPVANGNLGDSIIYSDSSLPFTGFYESQRYRLKVTYSACGNFTSSNNNVPDFNELIKRSEIINKMWLCGSKVSVDSLGSIDQMINSVDSLLDLGITLDPNNTDTTLTLMDSSYTNNYLFYCETFGGLHYFLSQDAKNFSGITNLPGCDYQISAISRTERGGYEQFQRSYPYEFRPPALTVDSLVFNVPAGTYIKQAFIQHQCFVYDFGTASPKWKSTNLVPIQLSDTVGKVVFYNTQLPLGVCLDDSSVFPVSLGDTNLYVTSGLNHREIYFTLAPLTCADSGFVVNDTSLVAHFSNYQPTCTDSILCGETFSIDRNAFAIAGIANNYHTPNLIVQTTVDTIDLFQNSFCIDLTYTNPTRIINGITVAEDAGFVYIQLPNNPAFTNWQLVQGNDTILPVNGVIPVDSSFANNAAVTYSLCAQVNSCETLPTIEIKTGWNCEGFPVDALDTSTCGKFTFPVSFSQSNTALTNSGKSPQNATVALCDTIFASAIFQNTGQGHLTPAYVALGGNNSGLELLGVWISNNCMFPALAPDSIQLSYDSLTQTWPITTADLLAINLNNYLGDSAISAGECISINAHFRPGCDYEQAQDSLPAITLYGISYCGEIKSSEARYGFAIVISGNQCTNCFTVTKTASQNPVPAGDTLAFNIIITGNNGSAQLVWVTEYYPSDFIVVDSLYPSVYWIPAQGSDTITVTGYFNTVGPCDDTAHINTVIVYGNQYQDTASVCVEVSNPCLDGTETTLRNNSSVIADGLSTPIINQRFFLEGAYTIDSDLELINCTIVANAGAIIYVSPGSNFRVTDTTMIAGCDSMWQGIRLAQEAQMELSNNSTIMDADIGVEQADGSFLTILNAEIINSVTGVKVIGSPGSGFSGLISFELAKFGLVSSNFKKDYIGQPTHGKIPYAGIDITDANLALGGGAGAPSLFYKMNKGICGLRTELEIKNCKFLGIQQDTAYHTSSDGSAVVSLGDFNSGPSYLQLFPANYPDTTVMASYRAVYNEYSNLIVQYCTFHDVRTGIECTANKLRQYSLITDNIINARLYGINYYDNLGADYNQAALNDITISGMNTGVGISVREATNSASGNYKINNNTMIRVVDGAAGIQLMNVNSPLVNCNIIELERGSESSIATTGIALQGCRSANVTQNAVTGYTRTNTSRIGISNTISTDGLLSCNVVDSTGYGFFFGSNNLNTNFRGNMMRSHLEGLHLNTTAIIDTQQHAGNRWMVNYTPWFGAVNLNAAIPGNVEKSLIIVDPSLGTTYNPSFPVGSPVNNTGWFFPDSGATFTCGNLPNCFQYEGNGEAGSPGLLAMIALDSVLSVDYVEESQSIGQSILYEILRRDSSLLIGNNVYQNFVSNEPVLQNLYEARISLQECHEVQDSLAVLLLTLDSTMKILGDSLRNYTKLQFQTGQQLETEIENIRASLLLYRTNYAALIQQLRTANNPVLARAGFYNNLVTNATELPEINEAILNEVEIAYETGGRASLINFYNQILPIAQQCPDQGGPSVFRARHFVAMVNDSIEYDDAGVCLSQGILRTANTKNSQQPCLILLPNPARDEVEVLLINYQEAKFNLRIIDLEGKNIFNSALERTYSPNKINTEILSPGVYIVEASNNGGVLCRTKLIIVR